jgi:hypothetical protein
MVLIIPSSDATDPDSAWPPRVVEFENTSSLISRPNADNARATSPARWKVPTILMSILASVLAIAFLLLGAWYLNKSLKKRRGRRQEMGQFGRLRDPESR